MKSHSIDISENDILKRVCFNDKTANQTLYEKYIRYLTAVCARYVVDDDNVRDVLQNAFLNIFSSIKRFKFRGEGSLKAWMTRIVVNESLKFIRSHQRLKFDSIDDSITDIADDDPDIDGVQPADIHMMIRELPVGYRTVLNLFVFEGKSHKEIATMLNITENTSASQFHRAKRLLKNKIKEYHRLSKL